MRRTLCLSHLISQDTPSYGDRDRVFIRSNSAIVRGDSSNSSAWFFSNNHIGTHVDLPYHASGQGRKTYEVAPDEYIFNSIQLVDIPCGEARLIGVDDLRKGVSLREDLELLLIRTGFEHFRRQPRYWNDNPGIAPEMAGYLREICPSLRCLGFDFISLTSWKFRTEGRQSHKEFLCPADGRKGIMILEDMSLKLLGDEIHWVVAAPLLVEDGNGGPVTVFAQ